MKTPRFRLLIADDHFVVREGLRAILSRVPGFVMAGEAENGMEVVEKFASLRPDITIMDLRMPLRGGIEAIRLIRQMDSEARILVLSNFEGDEDIAAALDAGAMGYILKHGGGDKIVPAIHAIMEGRRWIPREIADHLTARKRSESLTAREREILHLMALGQDNKEIAAKIGVSRETVKSHVKSILGKLQVHNRTEAALAALRRGIVHPPAP